MRPALVCALLAASCAGADPAGPRSGDAEIRVPAEASSSPPTEGAVPERPETHHGQQPDPQLVARGEALFEELGCAVCHATDADTARVGPALGSLWDRLQGQHEGRLEHGVSPDDYVRTSLTDPSDYVVEGYTPAMPSYLRRLTDRNLDALVAFVRSLSADYSHTP